MDDSYKLRLIFQQSVDFYRIFLSLQNYFGDAWNVFDFIIVLGSFIDIIYSEVTNKGNKVNQIKPNSKKRKTTRSVLCYQKNSKRNSTLTLKVNQKLNLKEKRTLNCFRCHIFDSGTFNTTKSLTCQLKLYLMKFIVFRLRVQKVVKRP